MLRRSDPIPALKQQLAAELIRASRGWSCFELAGRTGESFSRVSRVRNGRLDGISLEALVRMLRKMSKSVVVTVVAEPCVR